MKEEHAILLAEKSEYVGDYDETLNLRDNYSGRCMYGRETWAVDGSEYIFNQCVTECVKDIIQDYTLDDDHDLDDLAERVAEFLNGTIHATTDDMGMGIIWY